MNTIYYIADSKRVTMDLNRWSHVSCVPKC